MAPVSLGIGRDSFPMWRNVSPSPLRGRIGKGPAALWSPIIENWEEFGKPG